jgi:cytidylate kinase
MMPGIPGISLYKTKSSKSIIIIWHTSLFLGRIAGWIWVNTNLVKIFLVAASGSKIRKILRRSPS